MVLYVHNSFLAIKEESILLLWVCACYKWTGYLQHTTIQSQPCAKMCPLLQSDSSPKIQKCIQLYLWSAQCISQYREGSGWHFKNARATSEFKGKDKISCKITKLNVFTNYQKSMEGCWIIVCSFTWEETVILPFQMCLWVSPCSNVLQLTDTRKSPWNWMKSRPAEDVFVQIVHFWRNLVSS